MAKWWVKEVFQTRTFSNRTDYVDLVDVRRCFWSLQSVLLVVLPGQIHGLLWARVSAECMHGSR